MNTTEWVSVASSEHFTYKAETDRPWKPETILELLEQAHQAFERLMGPGLDIVIEVEDRTCEPNSLGARAEINKQVHSDRDYTIAVKFICKFPRHYGHTDQERDLAYHLFVHELFHCWIGGNMSNDHGQIVEAITQYMTDRTLVHLGWSTKDLLIRERVNWQRIVDTVDPLHATIAKYKLLFDQMHIDNPEKLLDFCRDLAACFRQQRSQEETDISPILQQYLETECVKF